VKLFGCIIQGLPFISCRKNHAGVSCDAFDLCSGLPALVDLATMRDAVCRFDKDPNLVNFACPVNMIVDHSPSADFNQR